MKKIFILTVSIAALASCTKDYTCECTITETYGGNTDVNTSEVIVKDVSKSTVESASDCVSYDQTYVEYDGEVYTEKVDCTITKM